MEQGCYEYDYRGKVVLDVGGFEGESAVFFHSKGAKKIVIYEPVVEHHSVICENVCLNNVDAEVHCEGIAEGDGERVVVYDNVGLGFGFEEGEGLNRLSVKVRDVSRVIVTSGADVAKFDCEGAELSLLSVSKETLRLLEYVIVEVHTLQIRQQILEKFKNSDFIVNKDIDRGNNDGISVLHFKRK